jgi:hypothetical protein
MRVINSEKNEMGRTFITLAETKVFINNSKNPVLVGKE